MKRLFVAAAEVQSLFEENNWHFCFIGGVALQRWGENRLTRDIDISLLTGFQKEDEYIAKLLELFVPRRDDAFEFAQAARVVLAKTKDGIPLDIALAGFPFEEDIVARSSLFEYLPGEAILRTCSAEDLVVMKAFAARPQDRVDIRGVIVRQGPSLDRHAIIERLKPLAAIKEEPEIVDFVERLFTENG